MRIVGREIWSVLIRLGAYEDVLFTAEYMAEIYERNGMFEEAEIYRSLGSLEEGVEE